MGDYAMVQDERDEEYRRAWKEATASFKRRAKRRHLEAKVDGAAIGVMELNEGLASVSTTDEPEIDPIEDVIDTTIEKFGSQHEQIIREIAKAIHAPMMAEMERDRASAIGRIACYLVKGRDGGNIHARIHSLLHAIPRLAAVSGFASMRESAKECKVSVQWIKNGRDKWCALLEIPVPAEGQKKPEAKTKYSQKAKIDHWRKRKFQA